MAEYTGRISGRSAALIRVRLKTLLFYAILALIKVCSQMKRSPYNLPNLASSIFEWGPLQERRQGSIDSGYCLTAYLHLICPLGICIQGRFNETCKYTRKIFNPRAVRQSRTHVNASFLSQIFVDTIFQK